MEQAKSAFTSELSIEALRQNAFLESDIETLKNLAAEARQFEWNSIRSADEDSARRYSAVAEGCEADIKRLSTEYNDGAD
jgi:hypothetical protein